MISNSIVILSSLFAAAFFMAWLMRRDVREQIERPKYRFHDQVQNYDQQCRNPAVKSEVKDKESKDHARDY